MSQPEKHLSYTRVVVTALLLLYCSNSTSAQTSYPNVRAFLKSTLTGSGRLSVQAKGDLNGDALADWAGVVKRQEPDSSSTNQLYVLLRLRTGGYQLAEKSIEEEIPGMGCCWLESLKIRGSSIYVQNNAKGVSVFEEVTHQFKLYNGEWRLVGLRIHLTDNSPGNEGTVDTNMNVLTGNVIETFHRGKRKPVIKLSKKKFDTFLLKDFDFSTRFANDES